MHYSNSGETAAVEQPATAKRAAIQQALMHVSLDLVITCLIWVIEITAKLLCIDRRYLFRVIAIAIVVIKLMSTKIFMPGPCILQK
jgi:hypothetical protein